MFCRWMRLQKHVNALGAAVKAANTEKDDTILSQNVQDISMSWKHKSTVLKEKTDV